MNTFFVLYLSVFLTQVPLHQNIFDVHSFHKTNQKLPSSDPPPQSQWIYGPSVRTRPLHNTRCSDLGWSYDSNIYECGPDNWAFCKVKLYVQAPDGWHFEGEPEINCVQDNEGSFGWNAGYFSRLNKTNQSSPTYKEVQCLFSSKEITVNLKCRAVYDGHSKSNSSSNSNTSSNSNNSGNSKPAPQSGNLQPCGNGYYNPTSQACLSCQNKVTYQWYYQVFDKHWIWDPYFQYYRYETHFEVSRRAAWCP